MSNISKTYKELASPYFSEVFSLIEKSCREKNIPVYLIGAHAKIIQFLKMDIKPARGTGDIDFAIMVPDITNYENFLDSLINNGFRKTSEPYRIIHEETNTMVDILPFGNIEENYTIKFTDRKTELSVLGMDEVLNNAVQVYHESYNVRVPPLVGILLLKLISFSEKPDRKKDLDDIFEIIKNYFEVSSDIFYKNHLDIVESLNQDNFMQEAGAFMIGKDMGKILRENNFLKETIQRTIVAELNEEPGTISLYFLQREYYANNQVVKRIFTLINIGINT